MKKINNIHPGEVLFEELLKPLNISQNRIALAIEVPPRRINEICLCKRSISPDTALRLGRYFKMEPSFWLNLQNMYDMEKKADSNYKIYNNIKPFEARREVS